MHRDAAGRSLRCPAAGGTRTAFQLYIRASASGGFPSNLGTAVHLHICVSLQRSVAEYKNQYIRKDTFTEDKINSWGGWQWFVSFLCFVFFINYYYYYYYYFGLFSGLTKEPGNVGAEAGQRGDVSSGLFVPTSSKDTQS